MSRIDDEHLSDQISRISLNRFPHLITTRSNLPQQNRYIIVVERQHPTDESVKDDSSRPNIRRRSIVFISLRHHQRLHFTTREMGHTVITSGLA